MSGPEDQDIERAWAEIVANWDHVATKPPRQDDGQRGSEESSEGGDVDAHGVTLRAEAERRARLRREPARGDLADHHDGASDDKLWTEGAPIQDRGPEGASRLQRPATHDGPEQHEARDAADPGWSPPQPHGPGRDSPSLNAEALGGDGPRDMDAPGKGHDGKSARPLGGRGRGSTAGRGSTPGRADEARRGAHASHAGAPGPRTGKARWTRAAGWSQRLIRGPRRHSSGPAGDHPAGHRLDRTDGTPPDSTWERLLDEHFVPQEPPPIPQGTLVGRLAWAGVLLGPVLLLLFVLFWRNAPSAIIALPAFAVLGGFVTLVARLPGRRDEDDHGDGAVV